MNTMPNTIAQLIEARSRELTSRENTPKTQDLPRELTSRSREVYKEKKKEIQKESSRDSSEDGDWVEVSKETCLLAQRQASVPVAVTSSSPREKDTACQEEGVGNLGPRDVSSRWSGITVQHVRTTRGVKVAITLQQPDWAASGHCQMATAELKRYDRMREVRPGADDSEHFAQYLAQVKAQLQEQRSHLACVGRLHHRGRRSQWLLDTLIVAIFDQDRMTHVMLYLEGEEFVIDLDHVMSATQQRYYHSAGIHGQLHSAQKAPRLSDLPLVKFGAVP
jgi:hypothetical protein